MTSVRVLLAPTVGWLLAQSVKYILRLRKDGFQIKDFYTSGGFPSSHTCSTVALATYIGATDGWTSHIFGLAALFCAVVMYDAIGVRRAVGEHAEILKELVNKSGTKQKPAHIRTSLGHSPVEVFGGVVLGALVGLAFAAF